MHSKCRECGGELIQGTLAGNYITSFIPKGQEKRFFLKRSKVECSCCKECGLIQNMKAIELAKIL